MSARSPKGTDGKPKHDSETMARIAKAREWYRTRAQRRPQGQSRADFTKYDTLGYRRPMRDTTWLLEIFTPGIF